MTEASGEDGTLRCLVISDGRRGIENQALGLVEACAKIRSISIDRHHLNPKGWTSFLPPGIKARISSPDLPDCDVAIGCGRHAIPVLISLKRHKPEIFTIYIQDPRIDSSGFDIVIAPEHDHVSGQNVISMVGSPNRITPEKLNQGLTEFTEKISRFSDPAATFLIGGDSKRHKLSDGDHDLHISHAKQLISKGYSIWVTLSRRTPEFARQSWDEFAKANEQVWLYDGADDGMGANPYFAFLAKAKMILVTEDSTNMLTEACATGVPVFRLPMSGKSGKFQNLYDALDTRCGVKVFTHDFDLKDYVPLEETRRVAELLCGRF